MIAEESITAEGAVAAVGVTAARVAEETVEAGAVEAEAADAGAVEVGAADAEPKQGPGEEESLEYVGLTADEVKREDEFMEGIPRFNLAAFLLPPIWGPAHGNWITILYYPLWCFVDNCFFAAYIDPTPAKIIMAILVGVSLAVATYMFAMVAGPMAAHRAAERGVTKETYIRRQKIWAVVCIIFGALLLAGATYYNLAVRVTI